MAPAANSGREPGGGGRRGRDPDGRRTDDRTLLEEFRVKARLVGGALAVGGALGGIGVVVAVALDRPDLVDGLFLAGTVAFGFGTLGWAGSAMAGRGFEAMQAHLDTGTDWTEADSRRAMARVSGFGFGLMVGVAAVGTLLM